MSSALTGLCPVDGREKITTRNLHAHLHAMARRKIEIWRRHLGIQACVENVTSGLFSSPPQAGPARTVRDSRKRCGGLVNDVDVVVLGLGFTGLPMAVAAARAGARVVGLDSSAHRVSEIVQARPGAGLTTVSEDWLRELLSGGRLRLRATTDNPPAARTHVVCVQTPPGPGLDADLTALFSAIDLVAARLRPDDLVLVQSTCPPGTVEPLLAPRLAAGSGLRPGAAFFLAHSPVRTDPGREGPSGVPRVVGGMSPRCTAAATHFLTGLAERVVPVDGIGTAELVKVFENTFRLVNISLVNELADVCRAFGVDVHEVLDPAGTKPFGFLRHRPSPGAGGDCIPASARFFVAAARRHARS